MEHKHRWQIVIGLFSVFWLLIAFLGSVYAHKSFSVDEISGVLLSIWRTCIAITIISIAGGIGYLTKISKLDLHPFTLAMLTAAFGCGIMGIGVLIVGATIGINLLLWAILILLGILLRKQIFLWWNYLQPITTYGHNTSKFGKTILFLTIIILSCEYIKALAPPLQFDALTYHLAIPKIYLEMGRIVYVPENMFWGMPQQIEMLYTLSMLIGNNQAAPILGWWLCILTLLGLIGFVEKIFSRNAALVAVASLMCAFGITRLISSGYVEWATMLFGLATSICLTQWIISKDKSLLLMAGIFSGMAIGTKYTAGVIFLSGMVVILLFQKTYPPKQTLKYLILFGATTSALTLPWLIKNMVATSNPAYPFFFPAGAMDAIRVALYQTRPLTQNWLRIISLPIEATIMGVDGGEGFSASLGPLLLGLGLLGFIGQSKKTEEQQMTLKTNGTILIFGLFIWAIGSQFSDKLIQTRLYFVLFPAWACVCASGYTSILQIKTTQNIRFANIAAVFIIMALSFNTFFTTTNLFKSGAVLAALNPTMQDEYQKDNLGAYAQAMQTVNALPENARVLMLWETRGLLCSPKCDSDEVIDRWFHDWTLYHDPNTIIKAWKTEGYTHLLSYRFGADFIHSSPQYDHGTPESWNGLQTVINSLPQIKNVGNIYELYLLP